MAVAFGDVASVLSNQECLQQHTMLNALSNLVATFTV